MNNRQQCILQRISLQPVMTVQWRTPFTSLGQNSSHLRPAVKRYLTGEEVSLKMRQLYSDSLDVHEHAVHALGS